MVRCSGETMSFIRREMLALTSMAGKWLLLASRRDRTMCPSRMPRTVSAMGSLVSSPSTSTVYTPVIEPRRKFPLRSSSLGSSE